MVAKIIGIILAGGLGTRLYPVTQSTSKQLLPVYDKPLIYYPLSTLMLSGIKEIVLISRPDHLRDFELLLGSGSELGINITYLVQNEPAGIAESFLIASEQIKGKNCALILGDNLFYGPGLGRRLEEFHNLQGCQIFGYKVKDPTSYGVVEFDEMGKIEKIIEKPKAPKSNIAIPGLYFFDSEVLSYMESIEPSSRGELEIVSVINKYLKDGKLQIEMLPRGTAWFDAGTFADLNDASLYVRLVQERTGDLVGSPHEVARIRGWL